MKHLKQTINAALNYLAKHGFGTWADGVFYKNTNVDNLQLDNIHVTNEEYRDSLNAASAYAGFSQRPGKWQACLDRHDELYSK